MVLVIVITREEGPFVCLVSAYLGSFSVCF